MEKEITFPLALSQDELTLLDMHSFLNVLNVLIGEYMVLEELAHSQDALSGLIENTVSIASGLRDAEHTLHVLQNIDDYFEQARTHIAALYDDGIPAVSREEWSKSVENINSIFDVLAARASEYLGRVAQKGKWENYPIAALRNAYVNVLSAIEKNSKGRYHIVYNIAEKEESDYLIDFEITSEIGDTITLPPVFKDVIRDLVANARKYTAPGGRIMVGLLQKDGVITLVVEDTGMGIPVDQIRKVVEFGHRGRNMENKQTMGGGFGLTKAYAVVRSYGGRMWIKSRLHKGTRVKIVIPVPEG